MTREEAIETIRKCCPKVGDSQCDFESALRELIPELKESEDERIRKDIVAAVEMREDLTQGRKSEIYAYLERQKEQIPYTDFVIKPHKGDDTNPYDMSASEAQEYTIKRGFGIPFIDGEVYVDERHITQTIGNILRWADEHPKEEKPVPINPDDKQMLERIMAIVEFCNDKEIIWSWLCEKVKVAAQKPAEWNNAKINGEPISTENQTVKVGDDETEAQKAYREGKNAGRKEVFDHPEEYGLQLRRMYDYETGRRNPEWNEEDIKKIRSEEYTKGFNDAAFGGKLKEWSEEDEENFKWFDKFFRAESILIDGKDIPQDKYLWFKSLSPQPKQKWSEEDKKLIDDVINSLCCYQNTLSDYQKEIVGEEIRKLKSLKPQPKQEWSEKDEKMRDRLIDRLQFITLNTRTDTTSPNITFFDEIAWLKSLRSRPKASDNWKPTEEHFQGLRRAILKADTGSDTERTLKELYEQLKKRIRYESRYSR